MEELPESQQASCPALDSDLAEAAASQRWLRAGAWQHVTSPGFFLLHHFDRWVTARQGDKRVWILQGVLFAERERNPHSTGQFVVLTLQPLALNLPVLGEQGRGKGKELHLKRLVLVLVKAEMPHKGRHAFGPLQRPDFPNGLMSLLRFLITLLCRSNRRSCVADPDVPTTGPAHTAQGILPSNKTLRHPRQGILGALARPPRPAGIPAGRCSSRPARGEAGPRTRFGQIMQHGYPGGYRNGCREQGNYCDSPQPRAIDFVCINYIFTFKTLLFIELSKQVLIFTLQHRQVFLRARGLLSHSW